MVSQSPVYEALPHVGVGALRFGMSRSEVAAAIGSPDRTFRRNIHAEADTDWFGALGLAVSYGADGGCEAIEVFSPANLVVAGETLIGGSFEHVVERLKRVDPDVEVDESGATAYAIGIGVFAPHAAKEPSAPVESAIAFAADYYV